MGDSTRLPIRHVIWGARNVIILVLTPLLLLPLPLCIGTSASKCAFVVLMMAVYWVTEALPVGVTALIPVALFPLFEIMPSELTASYYMNNMTLLFTGGLCMAISLEYWNLHKRIALKILLLVGTEPKWLMLGMMLATWFLSMWISNTGTTAMMVPIITAVLDQMRKGKNSTIEDVESNVAASDDQGKSHEVDDKTNGSVVDSSNAPHVAKKEEKPVKSQERYVVAGEGDQYELKKTESEGEKHDNDDAHSDASDSQEDDHMAQMERGMLLCICYAANTGGIASLTGTGPNLVLKAMVDELYHKHDLPSPVSFGTWMAVGLPLSAVVLIVCWIWLQVAFLRCRGPCCSCCSPATENSRRVKELIAAEYRKLGPVSLSQKIVVSQFLILVILWITRDLGGVAGWGKSFPSGFVSSSCPAMLMTIMLFAIPRNIPRIGQKLCVPLMEWSYVQQKMPWHLLFLLGSGFALAKGSERSGLSYWLGTQLEVFNDVNQWAVLFIIGYFATFLTEVTSNSAIANLLLPMLIQLALRTGVHPLNYMFPAALACSFAYMLPVATPPNAIVYATNKVKMSLMIKIGFVMNILAVPCLIVITRILGDAVFDFGNVPAAFSTDTESTQLAHA
ncbi:solute carrier family 13 member 5 [Aplysia californica]|uniref:Solute carrier family 13 member 5 n=1 Tax=Aplysia californica TaxID=6500 RepID=A0ABM1A7G0_APLCA|nr:solute carrier family 13 member 5 [Aplysia californica]